MQLTVDQKTLCYRQEWGRPKEIISIPGGYLVRFSFAISAVYDTAAQPFFKDYAASNWQHCKPNNAIESGMVGKQTLKYTSRRLIPTFF